MGSRRSPLIAAALVAVLLTACAPSASGPTASPTPPSPTALPTVMPSAAPSDVPAAWRQLTPSGSGPAPREDHTWTVDSQGRFAYLFGGRDDTGPGSFGDLWAYDLATDSWQQLSGGPPARFGHNAAWVPGIGLVIFAGQDQAFFNDLWAYDPDAGSWRQLPGDGDRPVSRYGSCAALGPDGRLWISHGFTSEGSRFADTRAYDFASGTWTDETPAGAVPTARCLHACWWTAGGRFTLYGGQTTGVTSLGDRWELTVGPRPGTNAWQKLEDPDGSSPGDRNLYASTRWGSATLVFGGQTQDGSYFAYPVLVADDGTFAEVLPGVTGPSPRSGAELVADPERGRILLFGGKAGASVFGDLWELTLP